MEWLKTILEQAKLTEEGKLDVEAVMNAIQKEFPQHAVPKAEFNDKIKELKTANDTINTLKAENKDNESLQKKVGDYETEIQNLKKAAEQTAREYALKEQMTKQGVTDPDYLIYKAGGVEKFTFDKENHPVGMEEQLKAYREDKAMAHLFGTSESQNYHPEGGLGDVSGNPFAKETYNLTKQGELLKSNPEQAKILAAAAGITL